jgi:hypothetical protein
MDLLENPGGLCIFTHCQNKVYKTETMKKTTLITLLLCTIFARQAFSQTGTGSDVSSSNSSQNLMLNEFYAGYGGLSIFYFTGRMMHSNEFTYHYNTINGNHTSIVYNSPESWGNVFLGYSRNLNRVISMGFLFGFQNFSYTGTATESNTSQTQHKIEVNDLLFTGVARVLFTYVNKPVIRMYSGVAMGITIDFGKETRDGGQDKYSEKKIWPGGQLTLMGVRFGKAFGGFFEFGFGSYGIINAGISYKFAD